MNDLAKPPVESIRMVEKNEDQSPLDRGKRSFQEAEEPWFDLALVPELKKLTILDSNVPFKLESAKSLVALQELQIVETDFGPTPVKGDLMSQFLDALPLMPELESYLVLPFNYPGVGGWDARGRGITGTELIRLADKAPNLRRIEVFLHEIDSNTIELLKKPILWHQVDIGVNELSAENYHELVQSLLSLPQLRELELTNRCGYSEDDTYDQNKDKERELHQKMVSIGRPFKLNGSLLEVVHVNHLVDIEAIDCPNLRSLGFGYTDGRSRCVVKRCPQLDHCGTYHFLHCEDCPKLTSVCTGWRYDSFASTKVFFKNVGKVSRLGLNSLDNLATEGPIRIETMNVSGITQPKNPLPDIEVIKNLTLRSLFPEHVAMLKRVGHLNSLTLNCQPRNNELGWTRERISELLEVASTKELTIKQQWKKPLDLELFADLEKCNELECLCFEFFGELSNVLLPAGSHEEESLERRWALHFPETLKELRFSKHGNFDEDAAFLEFLANRYPKLTIKYRRVYDNRPWSVFSSPENE